MEGAASEAASLAGHLRLGRLIYLYDDNKISIEGSSEIPFTEDWGKRLKAYGCHVQKVVGGVDDLPTWAGTSKAHSEPPGDLELDGARASPSSS